MHEDPKSAKRKSSHQCLFVLLGSLRIKASSKTLVKLTPDDPIADDNIWADSVQPGIKCQSRIEVLS